MTDHIEQDQAAANDELTRTPRGPASVFGSKNHRIAVAPLAKPAAGSALEEGKATA